MQRAGLVTHRTTGISQAAPKNSSPPDSRSFHPELPRVPAERVGRPYGEGWAARRPVLTQLWADGHSAAEIGRLMGVTKNAIVGARRRFDLPPRPSPLGKGNRGLGARPAPRSVPRPPTVTLAPLASLAEAPMSRRRRARAGVAVSHLAAAALPAHPDPPPPAAAEPAHPCCWPIGEPRTPGFRFCGDPGEFGRPYCADHCRRAYQRVPAGWREEAA